MGISRGISPNALADALRNLQTDSTLKEPVAEAQRLLHELQVHQIELETQNRELRDAQHALEESRSRYADLFDFAPIGYCTFDRNGCVLEANIAASALFRAPRAQVVGTPFTALVSLDDPRAFRAHLKICFTEKVRVTTEVTFSTKNQPPLVVQMISSPVLGESGAVVACRTTLTNVSALKSSEGILRFLADASETLSSSLEYSNTLSTVVRLAVPVLADICFLDILDEEGRLRRLEVAFADPKKASMIDAIKRAAPDPASTAPEAQVLRSGKATVFSDAPAGLKAGLPAQLGLTATPITSIMYVPLIARERTLGVLTLIMSESSRYYSPRELAVALDVGRRAAMAIDNARLYEASRQAIRGREDILAIVSHDLKDPLNGITLAASTLVSWFQGPTEDSAVRLSNIIVRAARRMDRLIGELLDWSSIQAGRLSIRKRECTVAEIFGDVREIFAPLAEEKRVELSIQDSEVPISLLCDRERVFQVLSNLIANALKFVEPEGSISVRAEALSNEVRFSVSDTGPGIPQERLPHLFERFWQAEEGTRKKGRGLGLYIAKGIVLAHGGRIWAESRLGAGTTFFLVLPSALSDEVGSTELAKIATSSTRNALPKKAEEPLHDVVLVVDDDRDMRDLLSRILQDEGYQVVQMPNGEDALAYLRASGQRPRLIMLDLRMPIMDGWECMTELHNSAEFSGIPVVVVSSAEFAEQASSMGVGFIEKPVRIERLLETVRGYHPPRSSPPPAVVISET